MEVDDETDAFATGTLAQPMSPQQFQSQPQAQQNQGLV